MKLVRWMIVDEDEGVKMAPRMSIHEPATDMKEYDDEG